ncbi:50S ribosomal protein L37ae [Candidatus Woesearchaeota archaeon]|nr:50S ribosomal protein L37ae [Candidatus Woesearchaeota archaeon]
MAIQKKIASTKRFGVRYGRTVKHKFGALEASQRKKYKCPYCSKPSLKRLAVGIWYCVKCNSKIAGKAYAVSKRKSVKDMISDKSLIEEVPEIEETEQSEDKEEEEAVAA